MIFDLFILMLNKLTYLLGFTNQKNFDDAILEFIKNSGTIFIKYCQIITSGSNYSTSKEITNYLFNKMKNLQDNNDYNNIILFDNINYISTKPINTGSVANIFKIEYKNEICILKNLSYNAKNKIDLSFKNFKLIKNLIYYIDIKLYYFFKSLDSKEYYDLLINNLNLEQESLNLKKFKNIFKNYELFIIPNIFYFSKNKIIMSYENGYKINEIKEFFPLYYNDALLLIMSFIYLSLTNNIIHSDLHFSNFFFKIENDKIKMIILDFGMVKYLNDIESKLFLELFDCVDKKEFFKQINEILFHYSNKKYNICSYKYLKNIMDNNIDNLLIKLYDFIQILNLFNFIKNENNTLFTKFYNFLNQNNLITI